MSAVPAAPTEVPVEAVPDEVVDEEVTLDEESSDDAATDVEDEATTEDGSPTPEAVAASLAALDPEDPYRKAAEEALGLKQVPFEEREVQWQDEQETAEITGLTQAAFRQAAAYDPQEVYQRALATAYDFTAQEEARIAAQAKAIADGDLDPAQVLLFDGDGTAVKIANHVAQEVQAAAPAIRGQVATRILDTFLAGKRQSPVHKLLTREDRQAIAEAKKLPYVDHRIARIDAVYTNRAINGAGDIRETQTRAQKEAALERQKHVQTVAQALGKTMPGTRPNPKNDAARLADPNTPIAELIAIRRRQQSG